MTTIERLLAGHRPSADEGFSLAELMTVTVLIGVILAAAYLAMGTVNKVSDDMMARTQAQDQGQLAIEQMVRELRQGQIIYDGSSNPYHLYKMTTSSVAFYTDIDHDGFVERITYNVSGGLLTRSVARSNKTNPAPSDFGADSAPVTLAKVDPNDTTIFRYTDAASPPNFVTSESRVSAVLIDISTVASSGPASVTVTFPTAEADVRAFQ
jgi:prepilin-type N-terminal cleavage/methylation domain-containing protein